MEKEFKTDKNPLNAISGLLQLFIFYKPACLQKNFQRQSLSIRAFSMKGHYGLLVYLRGWTLSRHVITLNQ